MAADNAGVGTHALHKGVLGPLEHRLVVGSGHRPLLLGTHKAGQHRAFPGKQEHAPSGHQVKDHLVQPVPLLHRQVVQGPLAHPLHHGGCSGAPGQLRVLGHGPQQIVADALHPHHTAEVAQGQTVPGVLPHPHRPVDEIHTVPEDLLQPGQGDGPRIAGLLPGVGMGLSVGAIMGHGKSSFV